MNHSKILEERTLDEVLDRVTTHQNLQHVSVEHRSVQPVALETPPQKERPASPQNRTDERHIEVDARSYMRQLHALLETEAVALRDGLLQGGVWPSGPYSCGTHWLTLMVSVSPADQT